MRFDPLLHSSAVWILAATLAAILILYALATRRRVPGVPTAMRLLAVAALVVPAWTLVAWYRDLSRSREAASRLAIQVTPIVERAAVNGAALLCLGFLVMVGGIWLARRIR